MTRVVVLATGGTIASRFDASGSASVSDGGAELLTGLAGRPAQVDVVDVLHTNSYLMTLRDIRTVVDAVATQVARPDVRGVVVAHGTDTLEETACAVALCVDTPKPVVFTGAQRTPDSEDPDGERNLRDALHVATAESSRGRGVMVVFAGKVLPAVGCRKLRTLDLDAFDAVNVPPLGKITGSRLRYSGPPQRALGALEALPMTAAFDHAPVAVVMLYPGFDVRLLDACVAQGSAAVILGGMGAGNANPAVQAWVAQAVADGTMVGLSSRVPFGPVAALYGAGGGASLAAAGAVGMGGLSIFQARILVAVLASASGQSLAPRARSAVEALERRSSR